MASLLDSIYVRHEGPEPHAGTLALGESTMRCSLGRAGLTREKREGDGRTPIGRWPMRRLLFRPDRWRTSPTLLPSTPLAKDDGWCDDPEDPVYNQAVKLPYKGHCESLWRDDGLYDALIVLGYNDTPPLPWRGSAIFLHLARPDGGPTAGCIALAADDLAILLRRCSEQTAIVVEG